MGRRDHPDGSSGEFVLDGSVRAGQEAFAPGRAGRNPPPANVTTMPSSPSPAPAQRPGSAHPAVALVMGVLIVGAFLGLPIAGVVLAIMLIVSRRTASLNQVRASLGVIEAQLRALGAPDRPGDEPLG